MPAELGLIQRLHRYRLDNGVDIRDQVAIAVDEWLTREGYQPPRPAAFQDQVLEYVSTYVITYERGNVRNPWSRDHHR